VPPANLFNLLPANHDTISFADVRLIWECAGGDSDSITYDIYFGIEQQPPLHISDHEQSFLDLDSLEFTTTYYWQITANKNDEILLNGDVWYFTTDYPDNFPPSQPSNPVPADWETDLPVDITFSWECLDPDNDQIYYDFYLGTDTIPSLKYEDLADNQIEIDSLDYNTTYYWKIVAADGEFYQTSQLWRFTTEIELGIFLINSIELDGSARDICIHNNIASVAAFGAGVHNVDIYLPLWPELLSSIDTPMFSVAVKVAGDLAYVADGWGGLQIIDLENPVAPVIIGAFPSSGYSNDVDIENGYAYIADGLAGLQVVDISNPADPQSVFSYDLIDYSQSVKSNGNYIYLAAGSAGILIFDQSDMPAIELVDTLNTISYTRDMEIEGEFACIAIGGNGLLIADISNPSEPLIIGGCDTPGTALDCKILGQYCYLACNNYGLVAVDISNPYDPFIESYYETGGSVYAVESDDLYLYAACGVDGILIFEHED